MASREFFLAKHQRLQREKINESIVTALNQSPTQTQQDEQTDVRAFGYLSVQTQEGQGLLVPLQPGRSRGAVTHLGQHAVFLLQLSYSGLQLPNIGQG